MPEIEKKTKFLSVLALVLLVVSVASAAGTSISVNEQGTEETDLIERGEELIEEGDETDLGSIEDAEMKPNSQANIQDHGMQNYNLDEKRFVGPWPKFVGDVRGTGRSEHDTSGVDGTLAWEYDEGECMRSSSPVIGPDGTIYIGDGFGYLHAVSPDGSPEWTYEVGGSIYGSPTVGGDGTIYIGAYDNNLYAINQDGTEKWIFNAEGAIFDSPTIGPDNTLYFGSFDGYFYAVCAEEGTEKWSYYTGDSVWGHAAIDEDDNIYFGSDSGYAYAFTADGEKLWDYYIDDSVAAPHRGVRRGPAIGDDGNVYFAASGEPAPSYILALTPEGEKEWEYTINSIGIGSAPTIDPDGTIYVTDWINHQTHAINPDGTQEWIQNHGVYGSSITIGQDGTLYVGSETGYVYGLNPEDGSIEWSYSTGERIVYSSPAVGADGTVYIGDGGGSLYAFRNDITAPLAALTTDLEDEMLYPGDEVKITWDTMPGDGEITSVDLKYTTNGGYTWNFIEEGLDDTGEYDWTVPEEPSPNARIRLRVNDENHLRAYDMSEFFSIYTHPPASPENLSVTHLGSTQIFHDDIEGGEDLGYTTDLWAQYGRWIDQHQWEIKDNDAYIGDHSWDFGHPSAFQRMRYDMGSRSWLVSPEISLLGIEENVELSFAHQRELMWTLSHPNDGANLRISTEGEDGPWEIIEPREGYDGFVREIEAEANPMIDEPVWSGTEDWEKVHFDLGDYAGETIHLNWTVGTDCHWIDYDPFYYRIDDISIETEETMIGGEDNLLEWDASYDDYSGNESVTHYDVYRAESEDGPWDETTLIDSVDADGSEEYSYVDYGEGADTDENWYVIRAVDWVGQNDTNENSVKEVSPPGIEVLTPTKGEMLYPGDQENITWETEEGDGEITHVDLEYSPDGGNTWHVIADNREDTGEYDWTIPDENSNLVGVRATVYCDLGRRSLDVSDIFHIVGEEPGDISESRAQNFEYRTVFSDDVEQDKGYITGSLDGTSDWDRRSHHTYTGNYSWDWGDNSYDRQDELGLAWLITPEIDLEAPDHPETQAQLTFNHHRMMDISRYFMDGVNLRVSTEGPDGPWDILYPEVRLDGEGMYDRGGYFGALPNTPDQPLWSDDVWWENVRVDLTEYVGETIHLNWSAYTHWDMDYYPMGGYRLDNIEVGVRSPMHDVDQSHVVSWSASPDDGAGDNTVERYDIYRLDNNDDKIFLDSVNADGSSQYHKEIPLPPDSPDVEVDRIDVEPIFHDTVEDDKGYTTGTSQENVSEWDIRDHDASVGNQSWDFGDGDYYDLDSYHSWLKSPRISIPEYVREPKLTFDLWYDFGTTITDGGNLKVTTAEDPVVGPYDWRLLHPEEGYPSSSWVISDHPLAGSPVWGGVGDEWQSVTFDLEDYIGEEVHFRWDIGVCTHSAGDDDAGMRIDNISIETENIKVDMESETENGDHNLISWSASADDGIGRSVERYNIYRSESPDGPWNETTFVDSIDADGSPSYNYLDFEKGAADDVLWYYLVRAEDYLGQDDGNEEAVQEPEENGNGEAGTDEILDENEEYWYEIHTVDVHGQKTVHDPIEAVNPPSIEVTSPTEGDKLYYVDETETITWEAESPGEITEIVLEYTYDAGETWYPIDTLTEDTGSYEWSIPDEFSDLARVRATVYDDNLLSWSHHSGDFELAGSPPDSPANLEVNHYEKEVFHDTVEEDKGYITGEWEGASEWAIRDLGASVGDQAWDLGDGNYNRPDGGGLSWLISPEIELTEGLEESELRFDHWRDMNNVYEAGNLRISTDGGTTWEIIEPKEGYDGEITDFYDQPLAGEPGWGHQVDWEQATFDLGEYIGETVRFNWTFGAWSYEDWTDYEGWRIDNIVVETEGVIEGGSHNLLTWERSDDDGITRDTVAQYNIYRSRNEDGPWSKIGSVTADGSEHYQYLDEYAGDFDYNRWFYKVRPEDIGEQLDEEPLEPVYEPVADLSVDITTPSDNEVITTSNIAVDWDSTGSVDIDYYLVRINNEDWVYKGRQSNHNFLNLDDGTHEIEVKVVAEDGESVEDSVSFMVDTELPTVEITNPEKGVENLTYEEEFTIEGQTEPENTLYIDGEEVDVDDEGKFNYTTTLFEGQNIFEVRVVDPEEKESIAHVYALYLPQIPEIQDDIDNLQDEIDANRDSIDDLEDVTDQLSIDIGELEDELHAEVDRLETALDENVSALEDAIDENRTDLIDIIDNNITAIEDELADINDDITTIYDELEAINSEINDINAAIDDLNAEIDTIQTDIDDIDAEIDELEGQMDDLEAQLHDLQTQVDELESDLEVELDELRGQIEDLESEVEELREDVDDLEEEETPGFTLIPMVLVAAVLAVAIYYKKQQ